MNHMSTQSNHILSAAFTENNIKLKFILKFI